MPNGSPRSNKNSPKANKNSPEPSKKEVKQRLSAVNLALAKLADNFSNASDLQSNTVAEYIKKATKEQEAALQCLFSDNLSESYDLAGIAWLYANFGQQILESEQVEHMLGEGNTIELGDTAAQWQAKAFGLLEQLEEKIQYLRADIATITVSTKNG